MKRWSVSARRLWHREWMSVAFVAAAGTAMGVDAIPQPALVALVALAGSVGMLLAFVRPVDLLALLAVSIPVQASGAVDVAGVNITLTKLCIACLGIGWLARVAVGRRVAIDSVTWGYVAVGVALGISIVATSDFRAWAAELYRWVVAAFVFVVARAEITERRHVERLILAFSAAVTGLSAMAFHQVLTDDGPPSFMVNGLLRAYGTFGQPNPLAAYIELSIPLLAAMTVALIVRRPGTRMSSLVRWSMAAAIVAGSLTLFLTQSRGGWLGIGAAGVVLVAGLPPRARAGVVGAALGAVAGALIVGWGGLVTERLDSMFAVGGERVSVTTQNWANEERRAHWGAAINMLRTHLWTGVGAGGFNDAYREYTSEWRFRVSRGHAHSGYLHMAAQAGVAGLACFSLWLGAIMSRLGTGWLADRRSLGDGRLLGGIATIVAFGVHSMVDYLNVLSLGIQLALALAIAMASLSSQNGAMGEGTDTS